MAARDNDNSLGDDKLSKKKVSAGATYFDNADTLFSATDNNDQSDDEMINVSGAVHNEEQLILKSASQGKNKQTASAGDNSVVTDPRSAVTDSFSLTQKTSQSSNRRSLSKEKYEVSLLKDDHQHTIISNTIDTGPYSHPDLYPVSSSPPPVKNKNNVLEPSFHNTNNPYDVDVTEVRTSPSPRPTTASNLHHQHEHQQQQPGHFDPLTFADPTFINSFSPQLTPNGPPGGSSSNVLPPAGLSNLPFLGTPQGPAGPSTAHHPQNPSLLLLTPGEPQDPELFSVPSDIYSKTGQYDLNDPESLTFSHRSNAPDLIPTSDSSINKTSNLSSNPQRSSSSHFQPQHTSTTANLLDISYEEEDLNQQLYGSNHPNPSSSSRMNTSANNSDQNLFPLRDKVEGGGTNKATHSQNYLSTPRPVAITPGSPTAENLTHLTQHNRNIDGFVNEMATSVNSNPGIDDTVASSPSFSTFSTSQNKPTSSTAQTTSSSVDFYSSTSSNTNTNFSSSGSSPNAAPLFPNNTSNNTSSFGITNMLSVGRKTQSSRPKSEPAGYLTQRNQNQSTAKLSSTAAAGSAAGKNNNRAHPHAQQHGVSSQTSDGGPLRREMISPTMFGHYSYSDEYSNSSEHSSHHIQSSHSLFPPSGDETSSQSNATIISTNATSTAASATSTATDINGAATVIGDGSLDRGPGTMTSSGPSAAMYRDHCHSRRGARTVDRVARRQLSAVVFLCVLFMIGEAVGGALSNSLALFTDVLHLGSDLISFIISLLALYLSTKPASKTMSFGYHRAEVLGALFSVFLIWLVSGVLCYIAVERILEEHYKDVRPDEMLITASLGVVFNIIMGFVLHSEMCCKGAHSHSSFGHGHSHGHSHSNHSTANGDANSSNIEYQPLENSRAPSRRRRQLAEDVEYGPEEHTEETRKILDSTSSSLTGLDEDFGAAEEDHEGHGHHHGHGHSHAKHKNLNVRAAFIHVLGDIIQSLGVLVAACIIKFQPDERYRLADPICTFIFSIIVLVTTISVLRDTIRVMMEGVPRDLSFETLKRELLSIPGVVMVHSLHIWALTLDRNAISVHLAIDDPSIHHKVLAVATSLCQRKHQFYSSTIQVEMYHREAMNSCHQCQELE